MYAPRIQKGRKRNARGQNLTIILSAIWQHLNKHSQKLHLRRHIADEPRKISGLSSVKRLAYYPF